MMSQGVSPDVEEALANTTRHSAATIDHTEVHIDLSKNNNAPVITTGSLDVPGVKVDIILDFLKRTQMVCSNERPTFTVSYHNVYNNSDRSDSIGKRWETLFLT